MGGFGCATFAVLWSVSCCGLVLLVSRHSRKSLRSRQAREKKVCKRLRSPAGFQLRRIRRRCQKKSHRLSPITRSRLVAGGRVGRHDGDRHRHAAQRHCLVSAVPLFIVGYRYSGTAPATGNLTSLQHARVTLGEYEAGHMMYIKSDALGRLKEEVSGF